MNILPTKSFGLLLCIIPLLISCVKDVDFEQADEFMTSQRVDLDLVFFDLTTSNFIDASTDEVIPVVRDTTRLEFLDDSFIQDNLVGIDFLFQYDNTFSQTFFNRAVFLNEQDEILYETSFAVAPAPDGTSVQTQHIQEVVGADLDAIKRSIKMFIELTLEPNNQGINGTLKHKSKAIYSLEFSEL